MLTDFLAHTNATRHLNIQVGDLTEPASIKTPPTRPGDYAVAEKLASPIWHMARFDGKSWHAVGFFVGDDWVWCGLREPAKSVCDEPLEDWANRTLRDMQQKTEQALADLRADAQSEKDSGDRVADEIDKASAHADQETRQRAADILSVRLREIHDAIARLQRGDYGVCEATGEEIERARLRANPLAKYTFEYQQRLEMGRRGYAKGR